MEPSLPEQNIQTTAARTQEHAPIRLVVALKHRNPDALEKLFWSVSDPTSADYGKYLSLGELSALVGPDAAVFDKLAGWAKGCGGESVSVKQLTPGGEYVEITATAGAAERLLNCRMVSYATRPGCENGAYYLPEELARAVDFVGGAGVPRPRRARSMESGVLRSGMAGMTPAILRTMYNIGADVVASNTTTQSTAQFYTGQGENNYSPSDLTAFNAQFSPSSSDPSSIKSVGPNDPAHPGKEGTLDMQYLTSMGRGAQTWWWNVPGKDADFTDWVVAVLSTASPPLVHSVSYDDFEETLSLEFMRRGNEEFQKAGVRGLSLLFASGDFGTGCNSSSLPAKFAPEWPPSSPYVTSVGGTSHTPSSNTRSDSAQTEVAWSKGGGGFAYTAPQPAYQAKAVAAYLLTAKGKLPPQSLYNSSNRGFPDVAAFATDYNIVYESSVTTVSGTSASTPTWAGVVTLLNDLRLKAGKPPLGFLNQFLYQHADAMGDIVDGRNDFEACFTGNGFPATKGWDAATGLGVPDYAALAKAVMQV
jgi:tripeptidyl-peptidase-1